MAGHDHVTGSLTPPELPTGHHPIGVAGGRQADSGVDVLQEKLPDREPDAHSSRRVQPRRSLKSVQHDSGSDLPTPILLTACEVAALLRTSRKALYSMIERQQLPGVTRIGRRVLIRRDDLVRWLDQKRAPSLKE